MSKIEMRWNSADDMWPQACGAYTTVPNNINSNIARDKLRLDLCR
jgi:hypothetical protein